MRDKSHYSFLIAFARQLEAALTTAVDDEVADHLETLGSCLAVLLGASDGGSSPELAGDDESVEDDDSGGYGPPLGSPDCPVGTRRTSAIVDQPRRLVGGLQSTDAGRSLLDRLRPQPALLTSPTRARHRPGTPKARRKAVKRGKK